MEKTHSVHDDSGIPGLSPLDAGAGPALPLSDAVARRVVQNVLSKRQERGGRLYRFPKPALLGVGVLIAASAAAAGGGSLRDWVTSLVASAPPAFHEAQPVPSEQPAPQQRPRIAARDAVVQPVAPPAESAELEREPIEPAELNAALGTQEARKAPVTQAAAPPLPSEPAAIDRLAVASELRRQKRYSEALQSYLEVVERYPKTLEAQAARVSAAALRLEQFADAEGAQRLYQEASRGGGELSAEAEFGLAETHRAAGDTQAERAVLERFISRYPGSPLAKAAVRRLAALSTQ